MLADLLVKETDNRRIEGGQLRDEIVGVGWRPQDCLREMPAQPIKQYPLLQAIEENQMDSGPALCSFPGPGAVTSTIARSSSLVLKRQDQVPSSRSASGGPSARWTILRRRLRDRFTVLTAYHQGAPNMYSRSPR